MQTSLSRTRTCQRAVDRSEANVWGTRVIDGPESLIYGRLPFWSLEPGLPGYGQSGCSSVFWCGIPRTSSGHKTDLQVTYHKHDGEDHTRVSLPSQGRWSNCLWVWGRLKWLGPFPWIMSPVAWLCPTDGLWGQMSIWQSRSRMGGVRWVVSLFLHTYF